MIKPYLIQIDLYLDTEKPSADVSFSRFSCVKKRRPTRYNLKRLIGGSRLILTREKEVDKK